jgi:hypothetical protein
MSEHREQHRDSGNAALMNIHQLAGYLGVSVSWIKQHPEALPYVRIGAKIKRWRVADADAYVAKNLKGAVAG